MDHQATDDTMSTKAVAFLGPAASYTHQATKETFPEPDWELLPVVTIKDIFDVVQAGQAAFGVVPFENSTHGPVTFTLDSLADRHGIYGDLAVCAEIYLPVHHFLLGSKNAAAAAVRPPDESVQSSGTCTPTAAQPVPLRPRAKPLTSLRHIQRIYSHPQGFGQTVVFLGAYLKGVDTIDVSSTSKAAEMVARDESGTSAAISSEIAAEQHGLEVLARCIEDKEDNTTRFFVIRKGEGELPAFGRKGATATDTDRPTDTDQEVDGEGEKEGAAAKSKSKSLVSFTVPHRSPGALADVLECFRRCKLNLTSINSVPSLIRPFQYLFFVEFEGSRMDDPDGRVKCALEDVAKVAQSWRWLGSWENQRR